LECFYESFGVTRRAKANIDWKERLARFERWEKSFPESITALGWHASCSGVLHWFNQTVKKTEPDLTPSGHSRCRHQTA
jgi:hypothetical protein